MAAPPRDPDRTLIDPNARPTARPTTGPNAKIAARSNVLETGAVLNDTFEIRRLLGHGGMGQVFEAQDRMLERRVAIKVSWTHVGFEPLIAEARALAALRGRGVPCVYAIGKHECLGYYAMERLYGRTLSEHMIQRFSDGQFAIDEVVDLLCGIARALAYVHGAGLIHRDLKPSNIMLAPRNRTVLLDFGLFLTESRALCEPSICGSPRYIAPEIITSSLQAGQAHLIDIYALGVIAFMLISGHAPFDDPSVTKLLHKHVHVEPPLLSVMRPDVPAQLSRLVSEMMAKEPERRTFSAEAAVVLLRTIRAELGPVSEPVPLVRRVACEWPISALDSYDGSSATGLSL